MYAMYGDICHLCGHSGAGEVDHLTPLSLDPTQPIDPSLWRPAHGSNAPCPQCPTHEGKPRCCNQERGGITNRKRTRLYRPSMTW